MGATDIRTVTAVLAFDSRGTPTVSSEVVLESGARATATAPAGASTGSHEVRELRDGGSAFGGRGVDQALAAVERELAPAVQGLDALDQEAVDLALCRADGSEDLSRLGANAVLSVSLATSLAAAAGSGLSGYAFFAEKTRPLLPLPMVNIFSGGAHAEGALDIQDILAVPQGAGSFREAIEWVWEIRHWLAVSLAASGANTQLVADEGGFGVALASQRAALQLLTDAIVGVGLAPGSDVGIAIDVAATELLRDGRYRLDSEDRALTSEQFVDELADWCDAFPLISIEDALAEDDWTGWEYASARLSGIQLIGDDLFVTSGERLRRGIEAGIANSVLVKPNQCGTLSRAREVVRTAAAAGYSTVLSARSGEIEESWLADLAVGWRTGQIKVGSLTRSERTAKWNRLLRIEAELGEAAEFAGGGVLARGDASTQKKERSERHRRAAMDDEGGNDENDR